MESFDTDILKEKYWVATEVNNQNETRSSQYYTELENNDDKRRCLDLITYLFSLQFTTCMAINEKVDDQDVNVPDGNADGASLHHQADAHIARVTSLPALQWINPASTVEVRLHPIVRILSNSAPPGNFSKYTI